MTGSLRALVRLQVRARPVGTQQDSTFRGQYGGQNFDQIIYSQMGGVEIQITGAELQN